ncbi:MAG: HEAT repeat domain-containing protein [Deltaproteobacteria bacterium]|nr:HEAT repeat domain-containing protein [Deltaproteobacteria bacterium]
MIDRIEETLRKMAQSDPSQPVREAASSSLDRLRAKRSVDSCLQVLRTGALAERMRIVHSAEDIGGREGVTLLLAALSDTEAEVRGAAARALAFSPTVPVLKALADRLQKEQGVVLGNILETLGKSRRKELAPVIGRYLAHPDPFVCGKAVQAYALLAEKEDWEKILLLTGSENETVRAAAAAALSEWSAADSPGA